MKAKSILLLLSCAVLVLDFQANACAEDFDSAGVKIHYTVTGAGESVVLIHGLYSSARMNWDLPGITRELAKHYQVIELDARGHGQSDKPQAEGEYGQKMAEDVIRLMDHLHIEKARVAGYSMGGMIAMKLLVTHPDRFTCGVLGRMGWLKTGSPLQQFWESTSGRGMGVPTACLHGFAEFAVTEKEVKEIRVPVAIIVGDRDPCRKLYVEPLLAIRPDWQAHVIAGAGHLNCVTKADFKTQLEAALK